MCRFAAKGCFVSGRNCALVLALASGYLVGQTPVSAGADHHSVLSPSFRRQVYAYVAPAGSTSPFFSHGFLIQFTHEVSSDASPSILLYNSSGLLEHSVAVWPQETSKLILTSVDVGKNQQLAYSGRQAKSDGTWEYFIAVADITGSNQRYFNTGRYLANEIAIADDGSIWTVGAERERASNQGPRVWDNYDVLRQFSPDGKVLQGLLPRWGTEASYAVEHQGATNPGNEPVVSEARGTSSSMGSTTTVLTYDKNGKLLATYGAPLWGPQPAYVHASSGYNQSWLRADGDGIVLYDGRIGVLRRYIGSNRSLTSFSIHLADNREMRITGFAVLSDGRILATRVAANRAHPSPSALEELTVGTSGNEVEWTKVSSGASGETPTEVGLTALGSDGTAIVLKSATREVTWAQVN